MIKNDFGQLVHSEFHGFSVYASKEGNWRDGMDILQMDILICLVILGMGCCGVVILTGLVISSRVYALIQLKNSLT